MQFLTVVIIFALNLFGYTLALPTARSANVWEDCLSGTSYYVCHANNFTGCCTVDPCNLPSCPSAGRIGIPSCLPGPQKLYQPTMHAIFPSSPSLSSEAPDIELIQSPSNSSYDQHQIAIFTSIPPSARNCFINWAVDSSPTSRFSVGDGVSSPLTTSLSSSAPASELTNPSPGLVDVTLIHSPLPDHITWDSITKLSGERIGRADFSFWPQQKRPQDHSVAAVPCDETLAFEMRVSGDEEGSVSLSQDRGSGWYLGYDC